MTDTLSLYPETWSAALNGEKILRGELTFCALEYMAHRLGQPVTMEELIAVSYPDTDNEPLGACSCIKSRIGEMRLAGLQIANVRGRGWMLSGVEVVYPEGM